MIRVRVDSRIRVPSHEVTTDVAEALAARFTHDNPEYRRQERAGRKNHGEPPAYRTHGRVPDGADEGGLRFALTFPRGGMERVREVLRAEGLAWTVDDEREGGDRKFPELDVRYHVPDHKLTPYPYQEAAIAAAIRRENCLIRAPTGSGKTCMGFAIAARLKVPTLVIVWSGNLMDQWVKRAGTELGIPREDVGVFGGGMRKFAPVTVAMQQSVYGTLRDGGPDALALKKFGCVIADEVQRFAAETLFDTVDPLPARYRIGISADESRKDGKEFLTYDLFGDVVADIKTADLVASGHILDVEVLAVPTEFRADWYKYRTDFNRLLEQMRASAPRNKVAVDLAVEEVERGEQVLLFSHRVEHCHELASMLVARGVPAGVMTGGKAGEQEFLKTREALLSGRLRAAVGTVQAIGQGLDLPSVSRGIVVTPIANNRQQFGQVRGRVCRTAEGKNGARLYVLWDRAVYGRNFLRNLVKWNTTVLVHAAGKWVTSDDFLRGSPGV